jgi:hypothetical protein
MPRDKTMTDEEWEELCFEVARMRLDISHGKYEWYESDAGPLDRLVEEAAKMRQALLENDINW